MRAARFEVSTKLLEKLLSLPSGARIIGAEMNSPISGMVELVVDDPTLPESEKPHEVTPTCTEHYVEWKWNLE